MGDGFDPVDFIVGGVLTAAGIIAAPVTGGASLYASKIGLGLMHSSIRGRPTRVLAQNANYDPTATQKVCYGGPLWVGLGGSSVWRRP